ncbi:substrate-binding domain-containing protein [Streptomyces sp. NBC_01262]|uniref:substrate-binding domain-containing protein n=1 Tax=Streptomyces sp. NBC_01262 TaxID=2903803 RepID=UPI002E3354B5|nr:substrate-binding domain-containing protein [Streptomyces sp. NBC_01262]
MPRNPAPRRPLALATVGLLILGSAACASTSATSAGSPEHPGALAKNCGTGKKFKIGFAQANNAEPYRQHVNAELTELAKGYPDFDITIADGRGDSNKQISDVENFSTQQVDLLMISPFEAQPLTQAVSQLYEKGIPVIELDRQTTGDKYTAFVGGDNQAIGKEAGTYTAQKVLADGGEVAILEGLTSTTPAVQRTKGFTEGVAVNPKIKVVAVQPADWLPDKAQTVFDAMLRANPGIKAVYANNDLMANGAYLALKGQNKVGDVAIIGTDGLPDQAGGDQAVLDGRMTATFVYPTGAKEALELAKSILVGCAKSVQRNTAVDTTLITKDNAQAAIDKAKS